MSQELPVLLAGHRDAPESLMLIGTRDAAGMVRVRRWDARDWSAPAEPAHESADTLLEWFVAQSRLPRPMNQSLTTVRLWLRGEGPQTYP